jgi:AcrR family transcriptional regulator
MTQSQTNEVIRSTAKRLFAQRGYDGVSIRTLSKESAVGVSSIYHFFTDKDVLLKAIYEDTNRRLGLARRDLKRRASAERMLAERIQFQFEHIEDIVFVLKYYLHYRQNFAGLPTKTLPPKSALHIEEVLHQGLSSGEFKLNADELMQCAKMITHMINGFLLEYYPYTPQGAERKRLVRDMTDFSMRALRLNKHQEGMPM